MPGQRCPPRRAGADPRTAAVILEPGSVIEGVDDSKRLTPAEREELDAAIRARAMAVAVGLVDAATIDRVNVLEATRRAMGRALQERVRREFTAEGSARRYAELAAALAGARA